MAEMTALQVSVLKQCQVLELVKASTIKGVNFLCMQKNLDEDFAFQKMVQTPYFLQFQREQMRYFTSPEFRDEGLGALKKRVAALETGDQTITFKEFHDYVWQITRLLWRRKFQRANSR